MKTLYHGAYLEAVWQSEQMAPDISSTDFAGENVIVTNLPEEEHLVLEDIAAETKKECGAQVESALEKENLKLVGALEDAVSVEISVENAGKEKVDKNGETVEITLPIPEKLELDEGLGKDYEIKAIHFLNGDSTKAKVLPVNVNEAKTFMTLTVKDGFSPFYFVKAEKPETVTVTIDNVPGGYIIAYTGSYNDKTYLPIGEPVELSAGTEIYLQSRSYYMDYYMGKLESVVADYGNGTPKELKMNNWNTLSGGECHIKASYTQGKNTYVYAPFSIGVKALTDARKGADYKAELRVLKKESSESQLSYVRLEDCKLRIATKEELVEAGVRESYAEKLVQEAEKFQFDPVSNILSSNGLVYDETTIGNNLHEVPFVIIYNDPVEGEQTYIAHNTSSDPAEPNIQPYSVNLEIGARILYYVPLLTRDKKYSSSQGASIGQQTLLYEEGVTNWDNAKPEEMLKTRNEFGEDNIPKMHNYIFDGWMNEDGQPYEAGSELKGRNAGFYAYARFVSETDSDVVYAAPEADLSIFDDISSEDPENPNNPSDPSNPSNPNNPNTPGTPGGNGSNSGSSGSSGGSGGGRSRRSSDLSAGSTNSYAMSGSWTTGANGWKFLKSNGEYATNTWGWINGRYYYFDASGNMATGWRNIGGRWYYMNPAEGNLQGAMLIGVIFDPAYNAYFYADASGAMVTGWYQVGANWYYFNPNSDGLQGALLADTYIDGYYVGADGAWIPVN